MLGFPVDGHIHVCSMTYQTNHTTEFSHTWYRPSKNNSTADVDQVLLLTLLSLLSVREQEEHLS